MTHKGLGCLAASLAIAALGCEQARGDRDPSPRKRQSDETPVVPKEIRVLDDDTRLGAPIGHANLTLIPVIARKPPAEHVDYLTLDEAFAQKVIEIREKQSEAVSELIVQNVSERPIFVMSGEVILGGKQDRVISKDTIIPAKEEAALPVYCVEQGRWTEGDVGKDGRSFRSAGTLAHTDLRLSANYGAQDEVWAEVSQKNAKRGAQNATGTYRTVATKKEMEKVISPYQVAFDTALATAPDRQSMVGYVVVMNGEITGVESFGSPALFAKLEDKLLRSYYLQSVDLPEIEDPAKLRWAPEVKDVQAFLAALEKAPSQAVLDTPAAATEQAIAPDTDTAGSKVVDKSRRGKAGEVYKSAYKKRK